MTILYSQSWKPEHWLFSCFHGAVATGSLVIQFWFGVLICLPNHSVGHSLTWATDQPPLLQTWTSAALSLPYPHPLLAFSLLNYNPLPSPHLLSLTPLSLWSLSLSLSVSFLFPFLFFWGFFCPIVLLYQHNDILKQLFLVPYNFSIKYLFKI